MNRARLHDAVIYKATAVSTPIPVTTYQILRLMLHFAKMVKQTPSAPATSEPIQSAKMQIPYTFPVPAGASREMYS
jgi:hypothetical protein